MKTRTKRAEEAITEAISKAQSERKEFLTPEHLLWAIMKQPEGQAILESYNQKWETVEQEINASLQHIDAIPEDIEDYELFLSKQMTDVLMTAEMMAEAASRENIDIPHLLHAILNLQDSFARNILVNFTTYDKGELLNTIVRAYEGEELEKHFGADLGEEDNDIEIEYINHGDDDTLTDVNGGYELDDNPWEGSSRSKSEAWKSLCTCINDQLSTHNPLIGRKAELDRTIQVLCRKDKNNPLHVGEPGVGKTAIVYGLAERIEKGDVPQRLVGAKIYQLDMATLIAGTQYRGEFEKRIKNIMKGAEKEGNAIIYIDEIHTLIGTGSTGDSALDGSNILKPYLESGTIRFIGSTTYQEYNRYFQKSKGIVRRFQQIDIPEPSQEETLHILQGLKERYETFHNVTYSDDILKYVVEVSVRYINDRFLPDKAIDLIDEAGAAKEASTTILDQANAKQGNAKEEESKEEEAKKNKQEAPSESTMPSRLREGKVQSEQPTTTQHPTPITQKDITAVLSRITKIEETTLKEDDTENLENLSTRIQSQIYGQDEAIRNVVEAVQMGKAGLLDDDKPIASLLFVGPTGVGKTEVCRILAKELGIELVRFDMSEYMEKHAVAKLIGSPAGYVGYEDGGLLTDAIRKTPHCVLLLDEIEKAHSDIYNILLQVMDYARLTDNKGQKADFRHVILVMTSNAGAQFATQASVGFGSSVSTGDAMLQTVRKTFKPEFLARLNNTVVFRDMDETMASLILDKKLRILQDRLKKKNVTLQLSPEAHDFLLHKGFNKKTGAREMDHQINRLLSPLLMREILFGTLKHGGTASINVSGDALSL